MNETTLDDLPTRPIVVMPLHSSIVSSRFLVNGSVKPLSLNRLTKVVCDALIPDVSVAENWMVEVHVALPLFTLELIVNVFGVLARNLTVVVSDTATVFTFVMEFDQFLLISFQEDDSSAFIIVI